MADLGKRSPAKMTGEGRWFSRTNDKSRPREGVIQDALPTVNLRLTSTMMGEAESL